MNDKERLILLLHTSGWDIFSKPVSDNTEKIADYLLEKGVIVPPCNVGQTVWFIRNKKIIETTVEKIILKNKGVYLKLDCNAMYETSCNSIGKTVFLTPEEAEKALAERQGKNEKP